MILYIIRHAIAEQAGSDSSEQQDSQRALTDEGRKKMRRIAQGLMELGVQMDLILTSPYVRAADTAHIVAKKLGLGSDKLVEMPNLSPLGQPERLINEINQNYGQLQNIALVGHEPSLSRLISVLLSGEPTLPIILKKGGVCRLSLDKLIYGRCATLEWLLAPSQLAEIGG